MENSALHRRINEILEENRQLQKEKETLLLEKTGWCQEKLKILSDEDEMVAKMQTLLSQLSAERTHYKVKVSELQETTQRQEEKLQIYEKEIQSIVQTAEAERNEIYAKVKTKFLEMQDEKTELLARIEQYQRDERVLQEKLRKKEEENEELKIEVSELTSRVKARNSDIPTITLTTTDASQMTSSNTQASQPLLWSRNISAPIKSTSTPPTIATTTSIGLSSIGSLGSIGTISGISSSVLPLGRPGETSNKFAEASTMDFQRFMRSSQQGIVIDSEEDIIMTKIDVNSAPVVKGGTLDKLVEKLTSEKSIDTEFVIAFLLTYRSFTTSQVLLDKLFARSNLLPPKNCTKEELQEFENKKMIIKIRIGNVLRTWLDKSYYDFVNDEPLKKRVFQLIDLLFGKDMSKLAETLKTKLLPQDQRAAPLRFITPAPPSIKPKSNLFIDFDPLEVARQMTLVESTLFQSIKPVECLNQAWNKKGAKEMAPNITSLISCFTETSNWVVAEIVGTDRLKQRVSVVKQFIRIAEKLRELNNFNGVMEVLTGLQSPAVHRLRQTWMKIESKKGLGASYRYLSEIFSPVSNHKNYRDELHSALPPCLPYFGLYLTDLTFIEVANGDTLDDRTDMINFEKRRKIAFVIREIQQYQQTHFSFDKVEVIQEYLKTVRKNPQSEEKQYQMSLECEPPQTSSASDTVC